MIKFAGHRSLSDWHDALVKEAFIGAVAKMGLGAGKMMLKNPLTTLGTALTVSDVAGAAGKGARQAAASAGRSALNVASHVGPTM